MLVTAASPVRYGGIGLEMKTKYRGLLLIPFAYFAASAFAQTRGGAVTIRYAVISPYIARLAGILILLVPRLLNYIVAVYLILVGLIGIFGV